MRINHETGHQSGRDLCDALLIELQVHAPTLERVIGPSSCAFLAPGQAKFVYVYHVKTDRHLNVFFRATSNMRGWQPPQGVRMSRRTKVDAGWAKRFPASLRVEGNSQLPSVAAFLLDRPLRLTVRTSPQSSASNRSPVSPAEEVAPTQAFAEGGVVRIAVNRYERDVRARAKCIAHYGAKCVACGFNFVAVYGPTLERFIHVHHLTPLARVGARYAVDPVRDLRPICPNCHAVVHRREPPYSIKEVQRLIGAWVGVLPPNNAVDEVVSERSARPHH